MADLILEIRLEVNVLDGGLLVAAAIDAFEGTLPGSNTPAEAAESFRRHLQVSPASAVQQLIDPPSLVRSVPGVALERVSVSGQDLRQT